MTSAPASLQQRHDVVAAASAALVGYGALAHQIQPADLGSKLGDLAEAQARIGAAMVELIAAAETAGVIEASQFASTRAWVADTAWHAAAQAGTLAAAARILHHPDLKPLAAALIATEFTPAVAVVISQEYAKTINAVECGSEETVLNLFIDAGAEFGASQVRQLRETVIAQYGTHGSFQQEQDRCRRQVDLTAGRCTADGVFQYQLTVDAEGRSQLEAAIARLAAPRPGPNGEPDERPVGRRRGEALIEALRRSVSIAASGQPAGSKATLMITMGLDDLIRRTGAGTVIGTTAQHTLIAPDTVRRLACDTGIIPAVLGSAVVKAAVSKTGSEIVDLGRQVRLFTPAQVKTLWGRDRHCTFDGCDAPAAYCDAHHLVHWADGGPTNLDNAALLCGRHHTVVQHPSSTSANVRAGALSGKTGRSGRRGRTTAAGGGRCAPGSSLPWLLRRCD